MADKQTVRGVAMRDFNDAGTTQSFEKGEGYDVKPGAFDNYKAAGLMKAEPKTDAASATGAQPDA
jgi:hypothetical protein